MSSPQKSRIVPSGVGRVSAEASSRPKVSSKSPSVPPKQLSVKKSATSPNGLPKPQHEVKVKKVDAKTENMLMEKVDKLMKLKEEVKGLDQQKRDLGKNAKERKKIQNALDDIGKRKLAGTIAGTAAAKKKAHQHRKPTMTIALASVENVLGATARLMIEKELKNIRALKPIGASMSPSNNGGGTGRKPTHRPILFMVPRTRKKRKFTSQERRDKHAAYMRDYKKKHKVEKGKPLVDNPEERLQQQKLAALARYREKATAITKERIAGLRPVKTSTPILTPTKQPARNMTSMVSKS